MGLSMENHHVYRLLAGCGAGVFGAMSPEKLALYVGSLCAIFTAAVNSGTAQNLSLPDRNGNRQRGDP
jgi:hypothetical protein